MSYIAAGLIATLSLVNLIIAWLIHKLQDEVLSLTKVTKFLLKDTADLKELAALLTQDVMNLQDRDEKVKLFHSVMAHDIKLTKEEMEKLKNDN